MEIRGKIIAVLPMQSGQGKNGEWRRQEYVLEHSLESQYPRKMVFSIWGDKIAQFQLQEGQMVKVDFDIDCREYNGRWYNDIRAWRVEQDNAGAVPAADNPYAAQQPPMAPPPPDYSSFHAPAAGSANNEPADDLPF